MSTNGCVNFIRGQQPCWGPFKCYVTQMGVGGVKFSGKKRYEGIRFYVISVTRGWVGVQFPEKKRYVTLECPLVVTNS